MSFVKYLERNNMKLTIQREATADLHARLLGKLASIMCVITTMKTTARGIRQARNDMATEMPGAVLLMYQLSATATQYLADLEKFNEDIADELQHSTME